MYARIEKFLWRAMKRGTLEIVDAEGRTHRFGDGTAWNLFDLIGAADPGGAAFEMGPATTASLEAFGARMALALHYYKTGKILPEIGAVAVKIYTNVVAMRARRQLEHKAEFVLRPVKAAHASVGLGPDTKVQELKLEGGGGLDHLSHMAPVHEHKADCRGRR